MLRPSSRTSAGHCGITGSPQGLSALGRADRFVGGGPDRVHPHLQVGRRISGVAVIDGCTSGQLDPGTRTGSGQVPALLSTSSTKPVMYLRVPTWAPLQAYLNGHHWLARQAGIDHTLEDNAFIAIDESMKPNRLDTHKLHRHLDRWARMFCPASRRFRAGCIMQAEYPPTSCSTARSKPLYSDRPHGRSQRRPTRWQPSWAAN